MNALIASAILALVAPAHAPVKVTTNAKPGEVITGERTIRVSVTANNAVTGVEFYVNGDLRDKDTSTPYEFTIDSLGESEGDVKLRFKAYTTEGESGETTVTVKIDNGLSKGAAYHIQHATDALGDGKWDEAITSGRIALRIDKNSDQARILVARGYLGKGAYDKAQKFAEDAVANDPNNAAAADLLSTVKLRLAFNTISRDTNGGAETLATIREALKSAAETRRKAADAALDKIGQPTDANVVQYTDAALAAGRYGAAVIALDPAYTKDQRRTDLGNRLAYALMRSGRTRDALVTLQEVTKYGKPDAYTQAMLAVLLAETGDVAGSDAALKTALVTDPEDPAVISAQAFLALKFVRSTVGGQTSIFLNYDDVSPALRAESRKGLRAALDQLEKSVGQRTEVNYFASALNNKLEEFSRGEMYFERAVLADPLNADAYVEQGNRSVGIALEGKTADQKDQREQRLETARAYYEAALAARPDSAQALSGLSLVSTLQRKYADAVNWGEAAVKASPNYAAAHAVLGTAYNLGGSAKRAEADATRRLNSAAGTTSDERAANEMKARGLESEANANFRTAQSEAATVWRLDPRLKGQELSKTNLAWRYLYTGGRLPVLPQPR